MMTHRRWRCAADDWSKSLGPTELVDVQEAAKKEFALLPPFFRSSANENSNQKGKSMS